MAETRYTARLVDAGYAIERGRDNTITCPVYDGATLTAPSSGTCTVRTEAGSFSTGAVSIVSDIAEYTVTAASMSDLPYGHGVSVEWALTMPDGVVHTFRSEGAICRVAGQQRVTPADLYRINPYLDPSNTSQRLWTQTGVDQCVEAHLEVEQELWSEGRRPWLVVSQAAIRQLELYTALRLCMSALASLGRPSLTEMADHYAAQAEALKSRTTLQYDEDGDGIIDNADHRSGYRAGSFRIGSVRNRTGTWR